MQCPECGYMMTAFDKECPRCEKAAQSQRACLKCGTAYAMRLAECPRCHHRNGLRATDTRPQAPTKTLGPAEPPAPAFALGAPFAPSPPQAQGESSLSSGRPAPVLPPDYLSCRVCGNAGVQKVSAICQSGTWTGQSQGESVGMAYGPNGPIPVVSRTSSGSTSATLLAQSLMPPKKPAYFVSGCLTGMGAVMAICGFVGAILCLTHGSDGAAGVVLCLLFFGAGAWIWISTNAADWKQRRRVEAQLPQWEHAMLIWNRLFYCPRCAHVFDPANGHFAGAHQMQTLLSHPAPPSNGPAQ